MKKLLNKLTATILVAGAGTAAYAVPANDTICTATDVSAITSTATVFAVTDANTATEDADTTCNSGTAPNTTTKFGVWYRYTAAANANVRIQETTGNDNVIAVFQGIDCLTTTQVAGACTDAAEDVLFSAVAGQTYYIMVGMFSNSAAPTAGGYSISFSAFATPANDVCSGATSVAAFPFTDTLEQRGLNDDADVSCNSGAIGTTLGAWYTYTAGVTAPVIFAETSTNDAILQVYTGACGSLVAGSCVDTNDTVTLNAVAGTTYRILVARWTGPSTTFFKGSTYTTSTTPITLTGTLLVPPLNDTCATAAPITSPFTGTVEVRAADANDDVSCNEIANSQLRRAVWYTYTPSSDGSLFCNETSAADVVFSIYTGSCGGLTEVGCNTGEPFIFPVTAGTPYTIAVGMFSSTTEPTAPYALNFELLTPPANDTCGTASTLPLPNGTATTDGRVAANDPDVSCNSSSALSGAVSGAWFRINAGVDSGTLSVTETSTNDVVLVLYQGPCDALSAPIYCSDPETNILATLNANTDYYLLVAQFGASNPIAPYAISYSFTAATGGCCVSGNCSALSASACATAGGTYLGAGASCAPPLNSTPFDSAGPFPVTIPDNLPAGISRSVTIAGSGATIDASGIAVTVGLTHTWVGDIILTISNGTVTADLVRRAGLGIAGSTTGDSSNFGGTYTFLDQGPNDLWAVAATGDTAFTIPSGSYIASTTLAAPSGLGAAFAGQPLDGTWTLVASDNAGSDTGPLNSFRVQLATFGAGVCPTGPTPCQLADFNDVDGVTADDIFAFLDAWFAQNGVCLSPATCTADINGVDDVTADDIFAFLDLWFTWNGTVTCP